MTNNPMTPPKNLELDNLVRDLTSVAPMAKSEVRGRIESLLQNQLQEIETEVEKLKTNHAHFDLTCLQFDPVIDQFLSIINKKKQ